MLFFIVVTEKHASWCKMTPVSWGKYGFGGGNPTASILAGVGTSIQPIRDKGRRRAAGCVQWAPNLVDGNLCRFPQTKAEMDSSGKPPKRCWCGTSVRATVLCQKGLHFPSRSYLLLSLIDALGYFRHRNSPKGLPARVQVSSLLRINYTLLEIDPRTMTSSRLLTPWTMAAVSEQEGAKEVRYLCQRPAISSTR